jgi:ArsR family transcriptional regulator
MDINKQVDIMKALGDVTRLAIVKKLSQFDSLNCSELSETFDLTQPTLSHHFKRLIESEIIIAKKEGTHMIYSLNKPLLKTSGISF